MDEVAAAIETKVSQQKHSIFASAWPQLVIGVICMVMIANLQYGWTFFVPDIQKHFGWDRSAIQIAFTLFVLFETWLVPVEGWFVDRFGPQIVVFIGGLACAFGWGMNSYATSLGQFYFAQIVAGVGAGAVYGTCIGNALKWFPSRRGIAAGLTAAGFGAGSALTVIPIQAMIKSEGFQNTFLYFGLGQGVVICLFAFAMVAPRVGQLGAAVVKHAAFHSLKEISGREIIGANRSWLIAAAVALAGGLTMWSMGLNFYIPLALALYIFIVGGSIVWSQGQPIFTLMYFMFVIVGAGGLIVTANLAPISLDLKVGTVPVTLAWMTLPALTFAATLDRTLNGLTRPFFGWVSDHIGRENTMFIAFFLEGIGIFMLYKLGSDPVWFVILSGLVFFAWGEIYSLFPATCTDTFGSKNASCNAGILYTAKGTAALLVPYASTIEKSTGSWDMVFILAASANILAALLAIGVLKPWRRKVIAGFNDIVHKNQL
ncbi:oxalate:formate antiporter [mine drainage metagenome]|uniref:Oxalate:formate antiporter n=1 Tax=mine drainage metagenome TaxID=410659 RepID=A0A1J5S1J3_9ZZZZ